MQLILLQTWGPCNAVSHKLDNHSTSTKQEMPLGEAAQEAGRDAVTSSEKAMKADWHENRSRQLQSNSRIAIGGWGEGCKGDLRGWGLPGCQDFTCCVASSATTAKSFSSTWLTWFPVMPILCTPTVTRRGSRAAIPRLPIYTYMYVYKYVYTCQSGCEQVHNQPSLRASQAWLNQVHQTRQA